MMIKVMMMMMVIMMLMIVIELMMMVIILVIMIMMMNIMTRMRIRTIMMMIPSKINLSLCSTQVIITISYFILVDIYCSSWTVCFLQCAKN